MIEYKERPQCRKVIERLFAQGIGLEEMSTNKNRFSDSIRKQAKKMLAENYF